MTSSENIDEFEIRYKPKFDGLEDDAEDFIENISGEEDEEMELNDFDPSMEVDINSRFVIVRDENGLKRPDKHFST